MQPINYDALRNAESATAQTAADQYLNDPSAAPKATRHALAKLLGAIVIGFILLALLPGVLKVIVFVLGLGVLFIYAAKYSKKHTQAVRQFVADNNWQLISPPSITVPSLSQPGQRAAVSGQAIAGTLGTTPFWLYTYVSGFGKQEANNEVLTLQLTGQLPTVTLDALANNVIGSNLLNHPKTRGLAEISLEGNFQQFFKVYMEPNQQLDVLTIITPEIMQQMIDDGALFDIDITGNCAHIISSSARVAYPYTKTMLTFGQILAQSLEAKLQTFSIGTNSNENQQET